MNTNDITLQFLTNPAYNINRPAVNPIKPVNENDIKFYKRRILSITKGFLKGDEVDATVKHAYDDYVKTMVQYIKTLDKKDLLQEEYKDIETDISCQRPSASDITAMNGLKDVNDVVFRKQPNITMDNFVTKKVKVNMDPLPQKKNINLRSQELKYKGLRHKKEYLNK